LDHGHERLYDRLTEEEREILRDVEARCWGSHDVSEEDVESHMRAMTPQAWERIQPVMLARVEASREAARHRGGTARLRGVHSDTAQVSR
jgi:hypothetical protein